MTAAIHLRRVLFFTLRIPLCVRRQGLYNLKSTTDNRENHEDAVKMMSALLPEIGKTQRGRRLVFTLVAHA